MDSENSWISAATEEGGHILDFWTLCLHMGLVRTTLGSLIESPVLEIKPRIGLWHPRSHAYFAEHEQEFCESQSENLIRGQKEFCEFQAEDKIRVAGA